jgi:hypothetical protein
VKLRHRLYLLVAGTLLPVAVGAFLAAKQTLEHSRATLERDAIGRARAAMSAVDAHLQGSLAALETLAASRNLESGDIQAFHAESQRVLRTQPGWVNVGLSTPAKIQLANAIFNFGKPEKYTQNVDDETFDTVVRTARPLVGNVASGTAVQRPTPRIRVPALYGEQVRYVLSAPLSLKHLTDLLQAQHLPDGWVIGVIDRNRNFVVRIPAVPAGIPAPDSFREVVDREAEGWSPSRTLEGQPVYTAYATSPLSGWVLGIGVPASTVDEPARRTYSMLAAGLALALAVGLFLAWLVARAFPDEPR